jgi:signal transduction histidine kinase
MHELPAEVCGALPRLRPVWGAGASVTLDDVAALIADAGEGVRTLLEMAHSCRAISQAAALFPGALELHMCIDAALRALCLHDEHAPRVIRRYTELPPVPCDPELMSHLLASVLCDAIDSCGRGGEVQIATSAMDAHAVVRIRDSGTHLPAVAPELAAEGVSLARRELGLAIGASIAQRHGGHLLMTGDPGAFTEVTLHLPLLGLDHPSLVRH